MLVLTEENTVLDLKLLGKKATDKRYSVFDYSNTKDSDYYFKPLIFLDIFDDTALDFRIGNNRIMIPEQWSLVMADPANGDVEIVAVEDINNRDFHAFVFNPHTCFYPKFMPVRMEDIFLEVRWVFPKMEPHRFLLVPLTNDNNPDCILLINEKDQKKISPPTLMTLTE